MFTISYILVSSILITSQGLVPANAVPGGGKLYGTDALSGNLYTIDPTTATATLIGPTGVISVPALAVDPNTGTMYAGQGGGAPNVYTVDPSTGLATILGDSGLGLASIGDMDFDSSGTLYAAVNLSGNPGGSDNLAIIDKTTGHATVIGSFGTCTGITVPSTGVGSCTLKGMDAIAFASDGTLYGATTSTTGSKLYKINTSTGHATIVASILDSSGAPVGGGVSALHFACDGTLYGGTAHGTGNLIKINPATGVFTLIGNSINNGGSLGALAFQNTCAVRERTGAVGGSIMPIDMTSLFVAGIFTNAFWVLPTAGGIAGAAITLFKVKRKRE